MNTKPRRMVLNAVFKQTQQLPDWPLAKIDGGRPVSAEDDGEMRQDARQQACVAENTPAGLVFTK